MGTPPSNLVGPFDVSATPGEPDESAACIRAKAGATSLQAVTPGAENVTKLETHFRSPQHTPEAWRLPRRAGPGVRLVDAPTRIPNSNSFEPDPWMPTPPLRRPSDPLSNRTKFLIASASIALLAGYFVFGSSDRPVDVAVAPPPTIDIPSIGFLPLREAQTPVATATPTGINVESRVELNVRTASLAPTARSDIKPTENEIEEKPPQTLPERGKQQLFAASSNDTTCFPSAAAVLLNHPGARPSWTLRAPGHEGTRCWFAANRTKFEAEAPSAKDRGSTVESRAELQVQAASLQPVVRLDTKPTESGTEARSPQTLPERGRQLVAASGDDSTCFPSASAVRQNHPGGWPSWTLRAPGHEGARCWYAAQANPGQ
jgi:hypothetical protein